MGNMLAFALLAIIIFFMLIFFLGEWGVILAAALLIGGLLAGLLSIVERLDRIEKKLDERNISRENLPAELEKVEDNHESEI